MIRTKKILALFLAVVLMFSALPFSVSADEIESMMETDAPVLFAQERPGLHGEIFKIYKFRTMTNERDENGELLPDEQRLTSFGKLLRSTSLDELPELGCILSVDRGIIGTTKKKP